MSDVCSSKRFAFHLFPRFSLVGYSGAVEALRLANEAAGFEYYSWQTVSADGKSVASACGLNVAVDHAVEGERALLSSSGKPAAVVLCGGSRAIAATPELLALVRAARSRGIRLVSLGGATRTLADAGMLRGRKCTVHWEMRPGFIERHPDIEVTNTLFEIDHLFMSGAGGGASFELMLNMIREDLGPDVADQVCEKSLVARSRERLPQRLQLQRRLGIRDPVVIRVVKEMEDHLEEPRPLGDLASAVGLSRRQVERIFVRELGRTPIDFYREIRLEHARLLLKDCALPLVDVATATGFINVSHFSRAYHTLFGERPSRTRSARRDFIEKERKPVAVARTISRVESGLGAPLRV